MYIIYLNTFVLPPGLVCLDYWGGGGGGLVGVWAAQMARSMGVVHNTLHLVEHLGYKVMIF